MSSPAKLASRALEKVWGSADTEPWYANPQQLSVGEIWFTASDKVPLLVKLLFTSDRLSMQVHPDDEYARTHELSLGKTEMWHILRADPGAEVGIGLHEELTKDRLREGCRTGEVADFLRWVPARVGDTFFVPAGTIHAIGGGLVLCEVQQRSDVTYRLHDYGRGREIHVERSLDVGRRTPYDGRVTHVPLGEGRDLLVCCEFFTTQRLQVKGQAACPVCTKNTLYIAVSGEGTLAGQEFRAGEAWEVEAGEEGIEIISGDATFLLTAA